MTIAICFGQFGPYHHARVVALQQAARDAAGDGRSDIGYGEAGRAEHCTSLNTENSVTQDSSLVTRHLSQSVQIIPVQIAAATTTYAWKTGDELRVTGKKWEGDARSTCAEGLLTLCGGVEEETSAWGVFLAARKLFRSQGIDVVFVPSYSPPRYFALFAAAKSLGLKTVMMNESHAGTEQARGWKKWVKRQIVRRFDAALVGGAPQKRHFVALGIPEEKVFTGYDAVDNEYFTEKAEEVRSLLTTH